MADERYEWLDRDAAERLLRGVPVDAADERARTDAARLAAALDSAADPGYRYDDGELPGEAAAMAAFRKARADVTAPGVAAGASLGTVRVARAARPGRGRGLGRPFRFGIATALAGCAIGGVAVAAGSGVLPSFGDDRPTPASSVSAAATPGPITSPTQSGPGTGSPSWSPGATGSPPVPPPVPGSTSPTPRETGMPTSGGTAGGGTAPGGDDLAKDSELYRKTVDACRDYRSGRIAQDSRRRLEAAAKGPARVERFCDQLLDGRPGDGGSDGSEGSGGSGGGSGEDGTGGKNSGGAGDRSGEGDADGDDLEHLPATPRVSWTLTPEPTAVTSPSVSSAPALSLAALQAF